MARMTLEDIPAAIRKTKEEGRKLTIHDPCVGSGAMLLDGQIVHCRLLGILDEFTQRREAQPALACARNNIG